MVRVRRPLPDTDDGRTPGRPINVEEHTEHDVTDHEDNVRYCPPGNASPQPASHYRGQANVGHLHPTQDSLRIRWPVFAGIRDIMVIDDPLDAYSSAKPLQNPDGSFHEVAYSAVTDPPCSSLEIGVDCLGVYSDETFMYCECEFADEEGSENDCTCGQFYRPPDPIHVIGTGERSTVTIKDVIETASPYLRSLKDDILRAKSHHLSSPLPPETQFYAGPVIYARRFLVFQDEGDSNQIEWERAARIANKLHNTPRELRS